MSSLAEQIFYWIYPPTVAGTDDRHKVQTVATSGAAANLDWTAAITPPEGSVMLTLEASGFDVWVRFKPTTAAAGTTTTNGLIIKAGQPGRTFYVDPIAHKVVDFIAGGVGSLQIQVSSPIGTRRTI